MAGTFARCLPHLPLALFLLACPYEREPEVDLAETGFVARAQRAELLIVGEVKGMSAGLLGGCGLGIAVEKVLHGVAEVTRQDSTDRWTSMESPANHRESLLWLYDQSGNCSGPPFSRRFVMSFDTHPAKRSTESSFPIGDRWYVAIDETDFLHGDLNRCHGVSLEYEGRDASNVAERMHLDELVAALSKDARPLCRRVMPQASGSSRPLEGQVFDSSGKPTWTLMEVVSIGRNQAVVPVGTDDEGRFQRSSVPAGPVWLRSPNEQFKPFLLPPEVRRVKVEIPLYPERPAVRSD